jgi:tRNA nucleotidyltransferase (CCA-adding enzyme)
MKKKFQNVGKFYLLVEFFYFYANFDFDRFVINSFKDEEIERVKDSNQRFAMVVIDPLNPNNNIAKSMSKKSLFKFQQECRRGMKELKKGNLFNYFINK